MQKWEGISPSLQMGPTWVITGRGAGRASEAEHNGLLTHPGRCGASVTAERALWPPGRALVPPPSQPGPAQSPQEVSRSKVGAVEARETGWQRKVYCVLLGGGAAAVCGEITPG